LNRIDKDINPDYLLHMNETCPAPEFRKYLPSDYRKKTVIVSRDVAPHAASVNSYCSYWGRGSISYYTLYRNGRAVPVSRSPVFPRFKNQTLELQPGDVLVQTGFFCGKTATARITFIRAETHAETGTRLHEALRNSPVK
jgi:hypothetical protein